MKPAPGSGPEPLALEQSVSAQEPDSLGSEPDQNTVWETVFSANGELLKKAIERFLACISFALGTKARAAAERSCRRRISPWTRRKNLRRIFQ